MLNDSNSAVATIGFTVKDKKMVLCEKSDAELDIS